MIAKQTSRLTRLVDDMLVLARADAGGYPIVQTQIRLTSSLPNAFANSRAGGGQEHHVEHRPPSDDGDGRRDVTAA